MYDDETDWERVEWVAEARISASLQRILDQISAKPGAHADSIELAIRDEIKRLM